MTNPQKRKERHQQRITLLALAGWTPYIVLTPTHSYFIAHAPTPDRPDLHVTNSGDEWETKRSNGKYVMVEWRDVSRAAVRVWAQYLEERRANERTEPSLPFPLVVK